MASFEWPPVTGSGGGGGSVNSVTASSPLHSSGGTDPNISIQMANTSQNGFLSSTDWNTFNNKQNALTLGNITDSGTDGIVITGGTGAIIGSGVALSQHVADTTHNGYLSSVDWNTFNSKIGPGDITKDPNTFAGFDNTGLLETIPGWAISTDTGGANAQQNLTPVDSNNNFIINNFQNQITPTADLNNLSYYNMQNYLYLLSDFAMNNTTGLSNGLETQGMGDKGNITALNNTISLGDSTNTSSTNNATGFNQTININNHQTVTNDVTLSNESINLNAGGSVVNLTGRNLNINLNDQVTNSLNLESMGVNVAVSQPSNVGLTGIDVSNQVSANLFFMNAFFCGTQLNAGANLSGGINAFGDGTHQLSGSTTHGVISYAAFPNFDSGSTLVGGYTGVDISPNISGDLTNAGANGFNFSGNIASPMQFSNAFNNFMNYNTGTTVTNEIQGFGENPQVNNGVTADSYGGIGIFPHFYPTSNVTNINGINMNLDYESTLSTNLTLANFSTSGNGTVTNLSGIQVNLAQTNSTTQKVGLNINDGSLQVQANYATDILPASPGFISLNGIGGLFNVKSGHPTTNTLTLANNFGVQAIFEDDYGPDPFLGTLGYVSNALTEQFVVATGKTVSAYNSLLVAGSIPPPPNPIVDGGTVTNYFLTRLFGVIPEGGTISITNQYQLYMDNGGASFATNAWGLFIADPSYQNYFKSSIAIDTTSTKVTNASVGLEIGSTTKAIRLSNLTTTQRNALTPLAGMEVFNTSTGQVEFYDGSAWVTGGGGGGSTENVEYHTVTSGEETAKQFTLSNTPTVGGNTLVDIITGGPQQLTVDFTITGNVFDWNGLGLDGILTAGDVVRLHYLS